MDETNSKIEKCRNMILSEDYIDLILNTGRQYNQFLPEEESTCMEMINSRFAIFHYPIAKISDITTVTYNYRILPKLYGLQDTTSMESAGIIRLRNLAGDRFRGKGVLIGFVDTGEGVIQLLCKDWRKARNAKLFPKLGFLFGGGLF